MKPIEPGCLAIVTDPQDNGTVVTCLKYVGKHPNLKGNDLWEVDKPLTWHKSGGKVLLSFCPERYLMRIDGFDPSEEKQEEAERNESL